MIILRGKSSPGRALAALVDLIVPPRCALCGGELDDPQAAATLCGECRAALLTTAAEPRCGRCAAILTTGDRLQPRDDCYHCRHDRPRFDAATALGSYAGLLRDALLQIKSRGSEHLSRALGMLLAECRCETVAAWKPDVVAPVPLHWRRRWSHGTNSAEFLAEALAAALGVPCDRRLVARHRATRPHAGLARTQRLQNVRGAFSVAESLRVAGKRVVFVDDILTTGATANELSRTAKKAGADFVAIVAAARTQSEP